MTTAVYDGPSKEDNSGRITAVRLADHGEFGSPTPNCFYCGEPTRYMNRLWHEETINGLVKGELAALVPVHMRCFLHRSKAPME